MRWLNGWSESAAWGRSRLRAAIFEHGASLVLVLLVGIASVFGGPRAWRALHLLLHVRRVREGRASAGDATLLYQRLLDVLDRRGFRKPAWFTPREFASSLPAETAMLVDQFTAAYNELRFGAKLDAAPRLTVLLEELETGRTGVPSL